MKALVEYANEVINNHSLRLRDRFWIRWNAIRIDTTKLKCVSCEIFIHEFVMLGKYRIPIVWNIDALINYLSESNTSAEEMPANEFVARYHIHSNTQISESEILFPSYRYPHLILVKPWFFANYTLIDGNHKLARACLLNQPVSACFSPCLARNLRLRNVS